MTYVTKFSLREIISDCNYESGTGSESGPVVNSGALDRLRQLTFGYHSRSADNQQATPVFIGIPIRFPDNDVIGARLHFFLVRRFDFF